MTDQRMLAAIRRRRARIASMGQLLLAAYEPADWRSRVRRSEVVEYMASRLGRGNRDSAVFVQEVTGYARALGWRLVRPRGWPHFRGVRRRQAVSG